MIESNEGGKKEREREIEKCGRERETVCEKQEKENNRNGHVCEE